ncbi:MAG: 2-vinyl bacteriochlorophyllide hydratase, partial [Pseudomonadota bacterium]
MDWRVAHPRGWMPHQPEGGGDMALRRATCAPGAGHQEAPRVRTHAARPIYSPAERARRDASVWTTVQAILAPLQFVVFLVSLGLVAYALYTGYGTTAAAISVVAKTLILYTIMVTGAIWE